MLAYGELAQRRLEASPTRTRIVVSYSRLTEDNSLENLPLLSLVLKRVSKDYPTGGVRAGAHGVRREAR